MLETIFTLAKYDHNKMPQIVSGVIKPKGRGTVEFLEHYMLRLFPGQSGLIQEAVRILKEDKERLETKPSTRDEVWRLYKQYCEKFPALERTLQVIPDYDRWGQPYRIGFKELIGQVDSLEVRLYGELNPIETLKDNRASFAVTGSDLLLAKFVTELPTGIDATDPAAILAGLPSNTTTIKYAFPLKIAPSRHMLITNVKPESFEVDDRGLPVLEERAQIAVNGEYFWMYDHLLNGRYTLLEGFKVEPFVLKPGKRRYGIEIVSSGDTLKKVARRNYSQLWVFQTPVYEAGVIVLVNPAREEGRKYYWGVVNHIRQIDRTIQIPERATAENMRQNLAGHLVR